MALTATISLSSAGPLQIEQQVNASVVVSNSGGAAINMNQIVPLVKLTGGTQSLDASSVGLGIVPLSQGFNVSVPAGSSATFMFSLVFHASSSGPIGAGSGTYDVDCLCYAADGSIFQSAAAATIKVIPQPYLANEQ